jgi:hypothetical protein
MANPDVAADVSPLIIPAGENVEPTHFGCYGIPNAAGATGRVARRTMLGDDGNQMMADGNSFPVFILGWTIGGKFASCSKLNWGDNPIMSAAEVIQQIKELPADERAQVAKFVVENDDSWIPDEFKEAMKDAEAGRFVDMETALHETPPTRLQ